MKLPVAIILLGLAVACFGLDYVPGPGHAVPTPESREYDFAYHNGSDDYHFYGSNIWAVRFDFHAVHPGLALCEFAASKALLYFPQTGDSVLVQLFTDTAGSPGTELSQVRAAVNSNYLELDFPQAVQSDSLWMLVTYATNFGNRFVSASAGGGTHSYYWNTSALNPYFQSLASAGYSAELLFGLAGDFVLSNPDLELADFDLVGTVKPRQVVYPSFRIYNHSDAPILDAVVCLNVYSPSPDFAFFDPITISDPIPARSFYQYDSASAGYSDHQIFLPDQPMQIKLRAALTSGIQDGDPQANNVQVINRFCLDDTYPVYLTENFLRWADAPAILAFQGQYDFPEFHTLNYFPILSDTLGNIGAQTRFNWYGFNALPKTVISGEHKISGFGAAYGTQYSQFCAESLAQHTFISSSNCRFTYTELTDILEADLTLTNDNTLLYDIATEYNLVGNSRLCIGLFKKVEIGSDTRYVLSRWIRHAAALESPLGMGQSLTVSFSLSLSELTLAELAADYRIYYWLQLNDGGRILYSAWQDITDVVSAQDALIRQPVLRLSSNPLMQGQTMKVSLSNGQDILSLRIYNLRGQQLLGLERPSRTVSINAGQFPTSGVYLMRASFRSTDGRIISQTKKINIIK